MPTAPSLRELQLELETILSRGGLPDRDAELARAVSLLPIEGDHRLPAVGRLRIYQGAIFERILEAIAEDFPASAAALGETAWRGLVGSYLEAHPTADASLRMAGRHLATFLRRPDTAAHPWQADLAELEWAMVCAFDAREERILLAEDLAALSPEAWLELHIRTSPCLVQLAPQFAVDAIRDALLAGDPASGDHDPCHLRVWRQGLRVYHKRIDPLEADALRLLDKGIRFVELCEWLSERRDRQDQDASAFTLGLLEGWVDDELLVAPGTSYTIGA